MMKTKMKHNLILFILAIATALYIAPTNCDFKPLTTHAFSSSARAMALIDMNSGRLLDGKNQNQKLKMASTTKIATAITVIDNCQNLDEPFKVDDRAIGVEGTSIYLQRGETLTARQLLYGLMLRSGNDASVALALHCANNISDFALLMNKTAEKAKALNTHFANPHGLDDDNHYTTAHDLALITAYALKNPTFKEIVSTKSIKIPHPEYSHRLLTNKNRLLGVLDGCIGVKTGYTKGAGRCFVGAVERENATMICVVLNCGPMFEECSQILNEGFEKYKNVELLPAYSYIRSIDVENGKKSKVKIYCPSGFCYLLGADEQENISIEYDLPSSLPAPIEKESKVGTVSIYFNNEKIFESDLLTMESVESEKLIEQIKDIIEKW